MTTLNHSRPYLKYVDNIMHEIAEIDSWYKTEKTSLNAAHDCSVRKKKVATTPSENGRKRPIREMDRKVHLLACSILNIMELQRAKGTSAEHANNLLDALPLGIRKNALIVWFQDFGLLSLNTETKKLRYDKKKTTQLVNAEAKPFWEYKPAAEYQCFNLYESIQTLVDRANRAETKHAGLNNIDPATLKALQALLVPK